MRALIIVVLLLAPLVQGQTTVETLLERKTLERIEKAGAALDGVLGVAAIDLSSGRVLSHHGDVLFPQASSIKVPVMIQVFRAAREGKLRLDDEVPVSTATVVEDSAAFERAAKTRGKMTARELVTVMIQHSDNSATNRLIDLVTMEAVNRTLDELDLVKTRLRRKMIDLAAAKRNEENVSTPLEMARLAGLLYQGKVIDAEASREMLEIMTLVKGAIRKAVPDTIRVAAKTGSLDGVRCETGVVFLDGRPFALSIASTYLAGDRNPVGEIARILLEYYDKLSRANRYGRFVR